MFVKTTALVLLIISICEGYPYTHDHHGGQSKIYDFIVVGAGTAGSVVANRLTEDGKYTVLLLEKGGQPNRFAEVPALAAVMFQTENADYYFVEKQPNTFLGLVDQQIIWLRGKGLGGTSLMNYMVYTHGHKEYYNRLEALGNPGWSYNDILPYIKRFEKTHSPNANPRTRGRSGELDVTETQNKSVAALAFIKASQEAGLPFLEDYNTQMPSGVGFVQTNIRDGRRCHSAKAFLSDIKDRDNLQIELNALVSKLIINKATKTVEGVEYIKNGRTFTARARREVVLSAGALASPQILMLSGIGPRRHLTQMGIEVIKDLPVGETISDHIIYPGLVFELNANITPTFQQVIDPNSWEQFLIDGEGPLSRPALSLEALGFYKTPVSNETIDYPDTEFIYLSGSFSSDQGTAMRTEWRIPDVVYDQLFRPFEGKPVWSTLLMLFRPESKGYLKLNTTNPADHPILYSGYFTDPENKDIKTMIAGIRMLQHISTRPALARYGSTLSTRSLPSCSHTRVDTDQYWECHIRHLANCAYHETATTRMGPASDPQAVVDHELKVHGIKNLRIADLGVFPDPITAHPQAPAMMVGAKVADMILNGGGSHGHHPPTGHPTRPNNPPDTLIFWD